MKKNIPPIVLSSLETSYTPEKVRVVIELTAADGQPFGVPPADVVKQIGPCLNYITFAFSPGQKTMKKRRQ